MVVIKVLFPIDIYYCFILQNKRKRQQTTDSKQAKKYKEFKF